MKYDQFEINNYRAIKGPLKISLKNKIIPLVGINECGKTTILQAIFAFDYSNDNLNESKHIKDIKNLYKLEDETCEIKATISASKSKLISIVDSIIVKNVTQQNNGLDTNNTNSTESNDDNNSIYSKIIEVLNKLADDEIIEITISRVLTEDENYYYMSCKQLNKIEGFEKIQKEVSRIIVYHMPPILYSDDFNDRPSGEVELTTTGDSSEWERIYLRVFNNALKRNDFKIISLFNEDPRRRKSTLNDVSKYLSNNLTDAWSRFSSEKKKITIQFELEEIENKKVLQINIVENINGDDRVFGITDRSKGFIWYYNFIMKIQFNPKQNYNENNTIFLLDEPGSYLHETAQNELCKKLVEISEGEGYVIYCTHSPQLLNPKYIPLSTINIVNKTKSRITCTQISSYKTKSTQTTAFQPVYEALQIPEFKVIDKNVSIVAGEGIHDKYSIEMFCDLPENTIVFGSSNAKSLHDNIQYFIAFSIKYVAIWDNDLEGVTYCETAKKDFGLFESDNLICLPNLFRKSKVRMEEMFEPEDMALINRTIGLPEDASYSLAISNLYYHKDREKILKKIKPNLSKKCTANFANLSSTIKSKLKK